MDFELNLNLDMSYSVLRLDGKMQKSTIVQSRKI